MKRRRSWSSPSMRFGSRKPSWTRTSPKRLPRTGVEVGLRGLGRGATIGVVRAPVNAALYGDENPDLDEGPNDDERSGKRDVPSVQEHAGPDAEVRQTGPVLDR